MSENIQEKDLSSWFEEGFTAYGMSVIKERAFVDVRDGLKPVGRAIVYEILNCGATSDSKPTKVARISGNVIGNWHPHGDKAVEDALTGLAQSWTNSLPIVYIKGNGGTVFGDGAAAGRYIEARLTPAGDAYGRNLKKGIVPFIPNFDETGEMPTVLPARLPYLLINGISEGIAVGVASVMPPHNPKEVLEMTIAYVKDSSLTTAQLLEIMPGPDFPTGATIINKDDMAGMYESGKGRILCRATLEYDKSDHSLHVKEIPFSFSGSMDNLVTELATATSETISNKKKMPPKIPGVLKVEDYSGKDGIDICLYLQKGVDPEEMKQLLYAKTRLESRVMFLFNALNDKEAHQYSLKRYLSEWLDFQHEITLNEYVLEKKSLAERLEIVTGRIIASKCIDPIIDMIKVAKNRAQIKDVLMNGTILEGTDPAYHQLVQSFRFTERQAESISETMLYQLAKLDRDALVEEGRRIRKKLEEVQNVIDDEDARKAVILSRLEEEYKKLPECPRRTVITQEAQSTADGLTEQVVPMFIAMDKYGYVRIESRYFEGSVETTSKSRVGFFDASGNCWNLYLDRVKETKDRGTLISRLLDTEAQIIGFSTHIEAEGDEGLFIFENGNMRRVEMSRYMTKTRATKINTRTEETPMKAFHDIPKSVNIVTVDGKDIPLDRIPLQALSGTGKQFLEQKEEPYAISFKIGEVEPEEEVPDKDEFNGVATFTKDNNLVFDWKSLRTDGRDGLFSITYKELIESTLLFVHKDGTAKRVKGDAFAVKTRRSQIKADKDGVEILCILKVPDTGYLLGMYEEDYKKCVTLTGISFQGVTGGGVRVFWSKSHAIESVAYVEEPPIPETSFASQPKQYTEAEAAAEEPAADDVSQYTTLGVEGFSCAFCGAEIGPDDPVAVCKDCGGIFCRECAENGNMADHECLDDETEE